MVKLCYVGLEMSIDLWFQASYITHVLQFAAASGIRVSRKVGEQAENCDRECDRIWIAVNLFRIEVLMLAESVAAIEGVDQ